MHLPAVPSEIPRSKILAFLADIGIDGDAVTADGIVINVNMIQCEVRVLGSNGRPLFDPASQTFATHSIAIPVVDR